MFDVVSIIIVVHTPLLRESNSYPTIVLHSYTGCNYSKPRARLADPDRSSIMESLLLSSPQRLTVHDGARDRTFSLPLSSRCTSCFYTRHGDMYDPFLGSPNL